MKNRQPHDQQQKNQQPDLVLQSDEMNHYSDLQINILKDKKILSYRQIVPKYQFTSGQQLEGFLYRTILGFRLDKIECEAGPIPLVPDILDKAFVDTCLQHAIELNCIYMHKALIILEDLLAERAFRSYQLANELNCPSLACYSIERLHDTYLSSQWFNSYCKKLDINIVNAQKREDLRRKYCTTRVMENFYALVKGLIHDTQALLCGKIHKNHRCMNRHCKNCKGNSHLNQIEISFPVITEEYNFSTFEENLINMFVSRNISITQIENPHFIQWLQVWDLMKI